MEAAEGDGAAALRSPESGYDFSDLSDVGEGQEAPAAAGSRGEQEAADDAADCGIDPFCDFAAAVPDLSPPASVGALASTPRPAPTGTARPASAPQQRVPHPPPRASPRTPARSSPRSARGLPEPRLIYDAALHRLTHRLAASKVELSQAIARKRMEVEGDVAKEQLRRKHLQETYDRISQRRQRERGLDDLRRQGVAAAVARAAERDRREAEQQDRARALQIELRSRGVVAGQRRQQLMDLRSRSARERTVVGHLVATQTRGTADSEFRHRIAMEEAVREHDDDARTARRRRRSVEAQQRAAAQREHERAVHERAAANESRRLSDSWCKLREQDERFGRWQSALSEAMRGVKEQSRAKRARRDYVLQCGKEIEEVNADTAAVVNQISDSLSELHRARWKEAIKRRREALHSVNRKKRDRAVGAREQQRALVEAARESAQRRLNAHAGRMELIERSKQQVREDSRTLRLSEFALRRAAMSGYSAARQLEQLKKLAPPRGRPGESS